MADPVEPKGVSPVRPGAGSGRVSKEIPAQPIPVPMDDKVDTEKRSTASFTTQPVRATHARPVVSEDSIQVDPLASLDPAHVEEALPLSETEKKIGKVMRIVPPTPPPASESSSEAEEPAPPPPPKKPPAVFHSNPASSAKGLAALSDEELVRLDAEAAARDAAAAAPPEEPPPAPAPVAHPRRDTPRLPIPAQPEEKPYEASGGGVVVLPERPSERVNISRVFQKAFAVKDTPVEHGPLVSPQTRKILLRVLAVVAVIIWPIVYQKISHETVTVTAPETPPHTSIASTDWFGETFVPALNGRFDKIEDRIDALPNQFWRSMIGTFTGMILAALVILASYYIYRRRQKTPEV